MKIGLYDSGLGGLSVLDRFARQYPEHSYLYFGDSARAPYGDKSPEELKTFVYEIFDYMQSKEVDLVISACNTSSMFLDEMDLSPYNFKVISLFDIMKTFFAKNIELEINKCARRSSATLLSKEKIAFLATPTNIDSQRYLDWGVEIEAIKCPALVPLVEAGELDAAKAEFINYLDMVSADINNVIVGCTHYSFLVPQNSRFSFLDPAEIALRSPLVHDAFELDESLDAQAKVELVSSANIFEFKQIAEKLLSIEQAEYQVYDSEQVLV